MSQTYISRGPRRYWLVAVLTAVDQGNCEPCKNLQPEVEQLAAMAHSERSPGSDHVFVANVDFLKNREVFQKLGLATAPSVILVPPTKSRKVTPLKRLLKSIGVKYQYSLQSGRTAEDLAKWVAKMSRVELTKQSSMADLPDLKVIVVAVVVALGSLYLLRRPLDMLRRQMLIYIMVCVAAYTFCIGGGMFNFIRHTPWAGRGQDGKAEWVSRQSRWQYQIEGCLVSALNLAAGVAAFLYINSQSAEPQRSAVYRLLRYVPAWLAIAFTLAACYGLLYVYTIKNTGYAMGNVGMKG